MEQKIILDAFTNHLEKLMKSISGNYDAFVLVSGKEEGSVKPRTRTMFIWLMAYDMIETILIITQKSVIYLASQKKLQMLEQAKAKLSGKVNFLLLPKSSTNLEAFQSMVDQIRKDSSSQSGTLNIAALMKEKQVGSLALEWQDFLRGQNIQPIDSSLLVQQLLCVKDSLEISYIHQSAQLTCYLVKKLISQVEHSIDQNLKVRHIDLANKVEALIDQPAEKSKLMNQLKLADGSYDLAFPPIIQSGGVYSLNPNASSSNSTLSTDVILLQIGGQVNVYNTAVARTLFIDPTDRQKKIYNHVLEVESKTCSLLVAGVKLSDVYAAIRKIYDSKRSELDIPEFPSSLGYGIGLEFREAALSISEKNEKLVESNQVFLVQVSIEAISNGQKGIIWSVSIGDIVSIENGSPQILTSTISKQYKNISYQLQDEEEEEEVNQKQKQSDSSRVQQGGGTLVTRTRGPRNQQILQQRQNEQQRQKHQQELLLKKQQELEERLERDGFSKEYQQTKPLELNKLTCYKQPEQLPREAKLGQIYIDHAREAILLPFQGTHVPFHVSCIKNVSKIDEGRIGCSLRINFFTNETSSATILFPQIDGQTIFIKELQYRSRTIVRLQELINQIKSLQKKVKAEQQVERERAHTGEVEPLIINRSGRKNIFKDLKIRPSLASGKGQGCLEIHNNGLRYVYNNKDVVDIVYRNVKHYVYQSPENEIIAALHFHLLSPIIIGKKKTSDVQFYCEVSGGVEHLEGRRRQQRNDDDEIEEEERSRVQRRKMHREFDAFIKSIEEAAKDYNVIFERPYRELGFEGNWNRARIFLQPTLNTLMSIVETPFFMLPLNEVEIACFERVMPGIKSFDLVFVFQNYEKPVLRLESIDVKDLEGVKNWLDRMNILFFEVAQNLVWKNVLGTISKDIEGFVQDGGWGTVLGEDEEDQDLEDQLEQGDSEFTPDQSQQGDESEYSDEDGDEAFDGDDDDADEGSDAEDEDEDELSDVLDLENLSDEEDQKPQPKKNIQVQIKRNPMQKRR